jgi:hypothetical protein
VRGRARLCLGDGDVTWRLDIEHLIGRTIYAGWLASFEDTERCRFGALSNYVPGFEQPCTLADLGLSDARPHLQLLAETTADADGTAHSTASLALHVCCQRRRCGC